MSYRSISYIILALILSLTGCRDDRRRPFSNYVVLVSFDGFRWDYPDLYKTPNLDRMALSGAKAVRMIPSFPSKTFPNHYALVTGLYPDHNGLVENSFFVPDLNKMYKMGDRQAIENPAFYSGEPIWITAMKNGIKTASFYWVGSEAPIMGMHPTYWKIYDGSVPFETRIDTVIKWLRYPRAKRPEFITLYFEEPDGVSSDFGPVSDRTGKMVTRLDDLLGGLRKKLSELPYARKITLIVVSDHGMGQISSDKYIDINKVVPKRMIKSITGGNPVFMIEPKGNSRDSILYLLNSVNGVTAWAKEDIPGYLHYGTNERIKEIVVVADSSWSIGTYPVKSAFIGGAHGYDITDSDMDAIFYACGPAIKKNFSFRELNNVDVYSLICRILKIVPAANDGNPANIEIIMK
jgi:predicted AlkP superfamily pyrophosphatase or phosphodiesterase